MRVAICDDNVNEREEYVGILKELARKHQVDMVISEYRDGIQLLFDLEEDNSQMDIIFLDVVMPKIDGIEVAQKLREYNCEGEIVFLTKSMEYTLSAFDVKAFNYLIKGEGQDRRFERVFLDAVEAANEKEQEYMLFTGVGESRNIAIKSIKYFDINHKVVTVHYNNDVFEFVSTLEKLENLLFTRRFIRVHRSFLVALGYVNKYSYEQITLSDGTMIPIGRKYYAGFKEAMGK